MVWSAGATDGAVTSLLLTLRPSLPQVFDGCFEREEMRRSSLGRGGGDAVSSVRGLCNGRSLHIPCVSPTLSKRRERPLFPLLSFLSLFPPSLHHARLADQADGSEPSLRPSALLSNRLQHLPRLLRPLSPSPASSPLALLPATFELTHVRGGLAAVLPRRA
jgi:hypothetical protein